MADVYLEDRRQGDIQGDAFDAKNRWAAFEMWCFGSQSPRLIKIFFIVFHLQVRHAGW